MRNLVRISLIVASSLVMTGLAVHSAVAGLSGCDNCINAGDIATDAVRAAEIKAGAVRKAEIATGAVGGAEIINGSIKLADLSAGVVPGAGEVALEGSVDAASPTTIDSFTVGVPGTGYLLVTVSGTFWSDRDSSGTTSVMDRPYLGLCTTAASSATCGDTWAPVAYEDPDNANNTNAMPAFSLSRVIAVSAGNTTLYFNGQKDGAAVSFLGGPAGYARATAVFVPGTLTLTAASAAAAPSGKASSN